MSRRAQLLLRYALALGAAALLVVFIDIDAMSHALGDAEPLLVLVGVAMGFGSWLLNTLKWQLLLASRGIQARFVALYRLNLTGALYGTVLPGQVAGEAAKMLRLARMPSDRGALVASVVADRVTGLIGLCIVGLVGCLASHRDPQVMLAIIGAGTFLTVALASLALVGPRPPRRTSVTESESRIGRLRGAVRSLWTALAQFREAPNAIAVALGLSTLFQLLVTLNVAVFAAALGLEVGVWDMAWIMAVVAVIQLLPVTVASVGTRDVAFVVLLDRLGTPSAEALALSVLVLVGNVAVAIGGAVSELVPDGPLRHDDVPNA